MSAPNNSLTLSVIAKHAARLTGKPASVEYPAFVAITNDDGGLIHVGTANGPWQADVFVKGADGTGEPAYTITVHGEHAEHAEGIARYVIGRVNHAHNLTAYATAAEERRADRDDRRARGRR
jgi:hypothetical protein